MSTIELQAIPERIQVETGDGYVSYVVWPAGIRRVVGRIVFESFSFFGCGILFLGLYIERPDFELIPIGIGGFVLIGIGRYRIQSLLYQAINAHASFTISESDLIVRSSGWFGARSIHWLCEEIRDVSYRLERNYQSGSSSFGAVDFSLRLGMWRRVVYVTTTPGTRIAVLEDSFLTKDEGEWLASAVRHALEQP